MTLTKWRGLRPESTDFRSADHFFNDRYRQLIDWDRMDGDNLTIPATNVREEEDQYFLEIATPGYKKDDFDITVNNQILTISAERKVSGKESDHSFTRREFQYNGFTRNFTLPEYAEEEYIKAKYEDGILKIDIPRQKQLENNDSPRRVLIQ